MKKRDEGGNKRIRKAGMPPKGAKSERPSVADVLALAVVLKPALASRHRKRVEPGAKLTLALSRDERNLIIHNWSISGGLREEQLKALEKAEKPELSMTLVDWEDFSGWVAGTGNHARSGSSLRSRADRFFDRIQHLLDSYTDE